MIPQQMYLLEDESHVGKPKLRDRGLGKLRELEAVEHHLAGSEADPFRRCCKAG